LNHNKNKNKQLVEYLYYLEKRSDVKSITLIRFIE
jgi:hypothetical protein